MIAKTLYDYSAQKFFITTPFPHMSRLPLLQVPFVYNLWKLRKRVVNPTLIGLRPS